MAFPTNQNLTTLLLQGLNVRTNANTPISSLYTIYANGTGQTFWGPSVNPVIMSSIFYSIGTTYTTLSTNTNVVANNLSTTAGNNYSTLSNTSQIGYSTLSSQIYITNFTLQSSVSSLQLTDSTLTSAITSLSTSINTNYNALSNSLAQSVYFAYVSTINYCISTLYGVSSFSTFYNEIDATNSTVKAGLSSLSTALYLQNTSTYNSLTTNYNTAIKNAAISTTNYTTSLFSSLSSYTVYNSQFSTFSTTITNQLFSTSDGLTLYISTTNAATNRSVSSINSFVQSTNSTLVTFNNAVTDFRNLSTNISSIAYSWISSFVSTSQSYQNSTIYSTIGVVSTNLSRLNVVFANYSTSTYSAISTMQSTIIKNSIDISSLQYQFSVLTTSSILAGIYESFIDLEIYTTSVIDANSTVNMQIFEAQFSTLASTYYVTIGSTIYSEVLSTIYVDFVSTIYSDVVSTVYTELISTAYTSFVSSVYANVVSTLSLSTLYTSQTINMTSNNFVGTMDLLSYRNFDVNVNNIVDNSTKYQLNYISNVANSNLDYREGNIFINISTVGQTYSLNNGKLRFDVYRYGFPSQQNESVFPLLGNGDYTLHYGYTIHNNTVFTNLLNAYPRLATYSLSLSADTARTVTQYDNALNPIGILYDYFWRGQPVQVNWSNYSYFPFASTGYMNFNPEINVDVLGNGQLCGSYGPFSLGQSTATVNMPYLNTSLLNTFATPPFINTTIRAYIVGKPMEAVELSVFTVQPCFTSMRMATDGTNFVMGNELVGITDIGSFPLYNRVPTVLSASGFTSYNNDTTYAGSNLFNGILNQAGSLGFSNVLQPDVNYTNTYTFKDDSATSGYASFYITLDGTTDISRFVTLQQDYGSEITATLTDTFSTIRFVCEPITVLDYTGIIYYTILSNTNVNISPAYTWNSLNTRFTLSYKPVLQTYTTGSYTESNFIGPVGPANPDPSARLDVNTLTTNSYYYPLSTLSFYNITDPTAPTYNSNIAGNTITGYTYDGTYNYGSTFILTNDLNAQVFNL